VSTLSAIWILSCWSQG